MYFGKYDLHLNTMFHIHFAFQTVFSVRPILTVIHHMRSDVEFSTCGIVVSVQVLPF